MFVSDIRSAPLVLVRGGSGPSDKTRGGGGGSDHPDPEIGGRSKKKNFSDLGASVWSKNKGMARAPPGPSPRSATVSAINTAEGEQRINTGLQDCLQLPHIGREKDFEE